MYVLAKTKDDTNLYLYKTFWDGFIFSQYPNVFFDTEEQATNFLHHNSSMFDHNDAKVTKWKGDKDGN